MSCSAELIIGHFRDAPATQIVLYSMRGRELSSTLPGRYDLLIRILQLGHPSPEQNELESSIMLSKPPASRPDIPPSRRGFALTLLKRTRNPSQLARAIYLSPQSVPHAMLSGREAETIGEELGIQRVDPSYFFTEQRWKEHRRGLGLPDEPYPPGRSPSQDEPPESLDQMPTGTVGAVALDCRGCIAAVTSTGGKTNKMVGRIGDTPQMGCGFWAEEWKERHLVKKVLNKLRGRPHTRAVGVSGTGDGDVNPLPL